MEIKNVIRSHERKDVKISIGVTKSLSEFMKANRISPTKVLEQSIEELMKEKNEK